MTNYIITEASDSILLIPGKLYAADFEVMDTIDLDRIRYSTEFMKYEKDQMEAALKITLKEKGHDCEFAQFNIETIHSDIAAGYDPPLDVTGSLDLGKSSAITLPLPKKIIRCYFRVRSVTVLVIIGAIVTAILTTSFLLVAPRFIGILEAGGDIIKTTKDLAIGIVQEPRKLAELGIIGFIPVIALIAAISFFVLKPRGAI